MKGFFRSNTFKVLLIMVMILLIIMIYTAAAGGSFISNILGFVSTPMQKISSTAVGNTAEFLNLDALSKEELKEMAQQLSDENNKLRQEVTQYYSISQEYEQLKKLLDIKEENKDAEYVAASVIQRDPNDVFYGFAIDKGYLAGVNKDDPVTTENGLVGWVSEVYATTCMVTSIFSEETRIAAISKELDEKGVLTSNVVMAATGTIRMEYLMNDTKMHEGAIITTSGAGGSYPRDLIVGYVVDVQQSENDISKYATIMPYEDIKNVKDVFVMIGFPGKGEESPDIDLETPANSDEDGQ